MQRKIWSLALVVAAVLLGACAAWAQADFYVIAGGGPPVGTKITSVPYTIDKPGFYFLAGNLNVSIDDLHVLTAILVNADDVTIDLMGFSLTNTGVVRTGVGIRICERTNVEIRNGTVRGFSKGIWEIGSPGHNHRAINVRATDNYEGISFYGYNHLIKNCNGSNNTGGGLAIWGSGLIINSVANNTVNGISFYGPGSVLENIACNNTVQNFYLGNKVATSILINGNSAFGRSPNYFTPAGTTGVVITANNSGTP